MYSSIKGPVLSTASDRAGNLWIVSGTTLVRITGYGQMTQVAQLPQLQYPTTYNLAYSDGGQVTVVRRQQRHRDYDAISPVETSLAPLSSDGELGTFTTFCVSAVPALECRNSQESIPETLFISLRDDQPSGSRPLAIEPAPRGALETSRCFTVTQWRKPEVALFAAAPSTLEHEIHLEGTVQTRVALGTGTCAVLAQESRQRSVSLTVYDRSLARKWSTVAIDRAAGSLQLGLGKLADGYLAAIEDNKGKLSFYRFHEDGRLGWRAVGIQDMPHYGIIASRGQGFFIAGTTRKNSLAVVCGH